MATLTVYPNSDGSGGTVEFDTVKATARAAPSDSVDTTATTHGLNWLSQDGGFYVYRLWYSFDTSALGGGIVTAATLSVKPSAVTAEAAVSLVASTQASNTALTTDDHASFGTTKFATDISDFTLDTFADYALNASGLAAISTTGYSKFCLLAADDLANGTTYGVNLTFYSVDHATSTNRPKLVITYTPAGSGFLAFL